MNEHEDNRNVDHDLSDAPFVLTIKFELTLMGNMPGHKIESFDEIGAGQHFPDR